MFRYHKINEDDKKETIILYDLKNKYKKQSFKNKEQELVHKEEKDLNKKKYYKIEDKKLEYLEKSFKQIKTKIKLGFDLTILSNQIVQFLPEFLFDIKKIGENKNILILYDKKYCPKLIEIETSGIIFFVEKLGNGDLVFLVYNKKEYEILIYRGIKNEKKGYFLSQKIKETIEGYEIKYERNKHHHYDHHGKEEVKSIEYELYYIIPISKNRFFCISNYGFKIYALNEKNEYELILLEPYEKIDFIYEIDANNFILGLNLRRVEGYGFCGNAYDCYYNLLLNKIELKNIDKTENICQKDKSNNYKESKDNKKNNGNLDILKVKEKLKYSFVSQKMFQFEDSSPLVDELKIFFSDFVILKNKFFIIMVENNILIFNIQDGKMLKKFEIDDNRNYFEKDIKKMDCKGNDEFILIAGDNVILFKLIEDNSSKISLNILNYAYFPELCINYKEDYFFTFKKLKKLKGNRFYSYNEKSNEILIY